MYGIVSNNPSIYYLKYAGDESETEKMFNMYFV